MSNEINVCTFTGRLGKDPEVKFLPDGTSVCNFSLASSTSNKKHPTIWVNCAAFGKLAEICGNYLKKGSHVGVSGELHQESYEKNGVTHYSTKLSVNNMKMLGKKESSDDEPKPAQKPATKPAQDFDDSDIPF